jgi:hypothetical protein
MPSPSFSQKRIAEKQFDKSFEEIYQSKIAKVYDKEIVEFFLGKSHFSGKGGRNWERNDGVLVSKGFIWVATHYDLQEPSRKVAETLTVEPMDCSQYEIAVRFPLVDDRCTHILALGNNHQIIAQGDAVFSGYRINEFGTMTGVCTSGH